MSSSVFVIIVNYNSGNSLLDALRSVYTSQGVSFEVFVVDNASTDGSLEKARERFSRSHFIVSPTNLGFSGGVNLGIRFALEKGADAVFLLNPDALIVSNTIARLFAIHNRYGGGIWSPRVLDSNGSVWFESGSIDWKRLRATHTKAPENKDYIDTDFVSGCAMFIDKTVFKKTGLFDDRFFLYYEDADFCLRAQKNGFSVRTALDISIIHHELSEENKPRKTYWLVRSGNYFFKKHTPLHLRPWIVLFTLARKIKSKKHLEKTPNDLIAQAVYRGLRELPYDL